MRSKVYFWVHKQRDDAHPKWLHRAEHCIARNRYSPSVVINIFNPGISKKKIRFNDPLNKGKRRKGMYM